MWAENGGLTALPRDGWLSPICHLLTHRWLQRAASLEVYGETGPSLPLPSRKSVQSSQDITTNVWDPPELPGALRR